MATIIGHETAARCWISGLFDEACIPAEYHGDTLMPGCDQVTPRSSLLAFDRICTDYRVALRFGEGNEERRSDLPWYVGANDSFKLTAARRDRLSRILGEIASHDMHVLVPDESSRLRLANAKVHMRGAPLPPGSLVRVMDGEDLFTVSPELAFLQMASVLSLPKLAQLGCELCSTYYYPPGAPNETGYRELGLTSADMLKRFLGEYGYGHYIKRAQRAAEFVIDATRSPMETTVALSLCLPIRLGGYGLPKPLVNYPVETFDSRKGRKTVRFVDLCWPNAHLAVEYNGQGFHTNEDDKTRDAFRQNDLVAEGWTVLAVTKDHYASMERFESLAVQIAARIGYRLRRERLKPFRERRRLVSLLMEGNSLSSLSASR